MVENLTEVMPKGIQSKKETSERVNLTEVGPAGPVIKLEEVENKKKLVQLRD